MPAKGNFAGRRSAVVVAILCALLAPSLRAGAAVIYVDDGATGGANNGSSWRNAFVDLQSALAIAQAGDEIRIAQGVYKPAPPGGPRTAIFNLIDAATLQGGYAGAASDMVN